MPIQAPANLNAIGAWFEVRTATGTQTRERTIGGGHAGGTLGFEHFGLGDATAAEILIQWPGDQISDWQHIDANAVYTVSRAADVLNIEFTPVELPR